MVAHTFKLRTQEVEAGKAGGLHSKLEASPEDILLSQKQSVYTLKPIRTNDGKLA